jgi:hypothetical protein
MMAPGTRSQKCVQMLSVNGIKVPEAIVTAIRNGEARPSAPPPGPLQQPPDSYGTALIRESLEKLFGPKQMRDAAPQAPPGSMPTVNGEPGAIDTEGFKKVLPIAAAALLAWKLLF